MSTSPSRWLASKKFIFAFEEMHLVDAFYNVSFPAGKIMVTFNTIHPLYEYFLKDLKDAENEIGFDCIKMVFASLARIEDVLSNGDIDEKKRFDNLKKSWGNYVGKMIEDYKGPIT